MQFDDSGFPYIEPGDDFKSCATRIAAISDNEFALFPYISADVVEEASLAGFMPMGIRVPSPNGEHDLLLPKLHQERCLLDPCSVRVTKTARRDARRYHISVNNAFNDVLTACVSKHGDDWLVSDLVAVMHLLHDERASRRVAFISVELWADDEGGPRLVAGEIGYVIGVCYASLSGFSSVSGAGTVQLAALGRLLAQSGLRVWDLGMEIGYKMRLGTRSLPRKAFLPILARAYADSSVPAASFKLEASKLLPARELLDDSVSQDGLC